jgi:heme exporter protein A
MKQRIKFIFALLHDPDIIFMDEPTSNLDNIGKNKVYELIEAESKTKIIIVASNEDSDLELCSKTIHIESYKNKG